MGPTSQSKRLPVSCEPCRKRKIRCTRNRPPCDTCLRRGLGPAECIYLGQPRHNIGQLSGDASNFAQEELFQRIRNLEDLLQKHVGSHALSQDEPDSPSTSNTSRYESPSSSNHNIANDPEAASDPMTQIIRNVGSLSISPAGHVRFEPRASQLNSELAQQSTQDYADELQKNNKEEACGFPFTWDVPPSRSELLGRLPPGRYCDELKCVYFRVFSPLFHILHDPTFEREYQQFREDPNSVSLSWLALLYVVLAIAVNALDDDHALLPDLGRQSNAIANVKLLAARYRAGAMQCLAADNVMTQHSIRTLQALVLLIYALNHSSQPSWVLVGMTHHIAIAMGCHLDPDHFGLGLLQAEERRRCWSGLVMLHMMQKISFRNLDEQRLSRRVRLPLDANDADLVDGAAAPQLPSGPTQMTYILYKFRLYNIALAICDEIFASSEPSQKAIAKLDGDIGIQQEEWKTRYASDSRQEPLPDHHITHMNILFGYSHQLSLLLHRPALNRLLSGEITDVTRNSRNKCLEAALGLLSIQKHLAESPQFNPYKWYTGGLASFHAFHAAVVLATIMMNPDSQGEFEEIREALRDAVKVFQLLARRSALCEKAVPILTRLVEVSSARPQSPPQTLPSATTASTGSSIGMSATPTDSVTYSPHGNHPLPTPQQQQQHPHPHQYQGEQQQYAYSSSAPGTIPNTSAAGVSGHLPNPGGGAPIYDLAAVEAIQAQLQAQYWVAPSGLAWGNWDFLLSDSGAQFYQQQVYHQQQQQMAYGFKNEQMAQFGAMGVPGAVGRSSLEEMRVST